QFAVFANQWLRQAVLMMRKVESVAPFDAEEIAIDSALVAVVAADDLRTGLRAADAQRGFTAVPAVSANRAHVIHLPRARLIAIGAGGKRADRADVYAHPALFAVEMILLIRGDDRTDAAVLNAERPNVHAFAADAHAAIAQNAARAVEIYYRRPLLFFAVILRLGELGLGSAVGKRHVLQFAFAAGVADRAIQRMVAEQQLNHCLAGLTHFIAVGRNDHALGHGCGACGLKLGHLLDLHHTHATRALKRKAGIVAKRRHFDACALAGFDQQTARRSFHRPAIHRDVDYRCCVCHEFL